MNYEWILTEIITIGVGLNNDEWYEKLKEIIVNYNKIHNTSYSIEYIIKDFLIGMVRKHYG